ncbi:hypothetical protein RHMOL_Rhmol01G0131300 [Rhododendron molle]|uniref:Uncharacterized protein n=1 Tax=Rhododendron molle TaxID=49168 RepID=A0ACC0Q498_RHOML|nr:hypothetical protein RHMOL_Rhmol01G0131300 [Rhododendron molle]
MPETDVTPDLSRVIGWRQRRDEVRQSVWPAQLNGGVVVHHGGLLRGIISAQPQLDAPRRVLDLRCPFPHSRCSTPRYFLQLPPSSNHHLHSPPFCTQRLSGSRLLLLAIRNSTETAPIASRLDADFVDALLHVLAAEEHSDSPVLPTLSIYKPEAYVPHLVALGPYRHFRPELYKMERFKLATATRLQSDFKTLEFKELIKAGESLRS